MAKHQENSVRPLLGAARGVLFNYQGLTSTEAKVFGGPFSGLQGKIKRQGIRLELNFEAGLRFCKAIDPKPTV